MRRTIGSKEEQSIEGARYVSLVKMQVKESRHLISSEHDII